MPADKTFDRTQPHTMPPDEEFALYPRTKLFVKATRVDGPFVAVTRDGPARCEDGWLALDEAGWPYPIAHDEFVQTYDARSPQTT